MTKISKLDLLKLLDILDYAYYNGNISIEQNVWIDVALFLLRVLNYTFIEKFIG